MLKKYNEEHFCNLFWVLLIRAFIDWTIYTSFLTTYISIKNVKKKIVGDFLKFKLALHSFKTISVDIEIQ